MTILNLPEYSFRIENRSGVLYIFDPVRKKFVTLSPEEWVRQHFIRFLNEEKKCPLSLMTVESGIRVHERAKRTDVVVHDKQGRPLMIVECKSPAVKITRETLDQASRYNLALDVRYVALTNGLEHYYCKTGAAGQSFRLLNELPVYTEL